MRPLHLLLRDLQKASDGGRLTPTFIDAYARLHGEKVPALYSLAHRNFLVVDHEAGRNDHVLRTPVSFSNGSEMLEAQERAGRHVLRAVRRAADDSRPYAMRNPTRFALPVLTEDGEAVRHEYLSDYLPRISDGASARPAPTTEKLQGPLNSG